jgi:hypothetical protein
MFRSFWKEEPLSYRNTHKPSFASISFAARCAVEQLEQRIHLSYDNRGKISVIVDETIADALSVELAQYKQDLIADGWTVVMHDGIENDAAPRMLDNANVWNNGVNPAQPRLTTAPDYRNDLQDVKNMIAGDNLDGTLKAVVIIGHVTVPYSGITSYDDHGGRAMPTDQYYADLDGTPFTWGDYKHDVTSWPDTDGGLETFEWTPNRPGDGRFDADAVPGDAQLITINGTGTFDLTFRGATTNPPLTAGANEDQIRAGAQKR